MVQQSLRMPFALVVALFLAVAAGAATPKDHALIRPYPGSVLTSARDLGFSEFRFVTGANAAGVTDEERLQHVLVSGNLTQLAYESPAGRSPLEIYTNYREGLEKAGFKVLYSCGDAECGPLRQSIGRLNGTRYTAPIMRFLTASLKRTGAESYVQVNLIQHRHEIFVLERTEMERGLVVVTPEAIRKGLLADGRVVLDGIVFDHDQATLKAESKPALEAIAKFLSGNPGVKAYIVGHTDGTGTFAHNQQLSRDRAATVVAALVRDYEIAASRLAAHGVGPLSPARSNRDESGRAGNRRVEMVEM